jgi:hypothetical protein
MYRSSGSASFGSDPDARAEVAPPADPVGGTGEDLKHRALGHPLLDRLFQRDRGLQTLLAFAALERRPPGLIVDHQIGVLRVARVDLRRLRLKLRAHRVDEPLRGGRQARLRAEFLKDRLALLPAEQLRSPVRVRLRPPDRDIAGPQLRREIREHARLEVPAVKPTGLLLPGPHEALPLLGGERQIDRHAARVVGDQIAGQMLVGQRVLERGEHRAVSAGRLKVDQAHEREHRRAIPAHLS